MTHDPPTTLQNVRERHGQLLNRAGELAIARREAQGKAQNIEAELALIATEETTVATALQDLTTAVDALTAAEQMLAKISAD